MISLKPQQKPRKTAPRPHIALVVPRPAEALLPEQVKLAGMASSFCGREQELAALELALADALKGRPRIALLTGEAGIGKTRLAEEFAARAEERGCSVLWGRCWEAGGAPSFWPWLEILRAAAALSRSPHDLDEFLPKLRSGAEEHALLAREDQESARFHLFEHAARVLVGGQKPYLVVLDDLHTADPLSLLFLTFLARTYRTAKLLVVGTYRDNEANLQSDVGRTLAKVAREGELLTLPRLGSADTARLVQAQSRRVLGEKTLRKVYDTTEGNPLFIAEIARLLVLRGEEAADAGLFPEGIREAIREHLSRLGEPVRELLAVASVFGREFAMRNLSAVSGASMDDVQAHLADALRAGVIGESLGATHRYRFSHILVREHLYRSLPASRAAELHAMIGGLIAREHGLGPGDHLALLAHHFLAASAVIGAQVAASHGIRAAEYAVEKLAYEDAATLYARVLATLGSAASETRRAEVLTALGEAELCAGQLTRGRETCVRASAAARTAGSAELMARSALAYASDYTQGIHDEQMVTLLQDAASALGEDDGPLRARVGARLATSLVPTADNREATAIGLAAIAMARRIGDQATLLYVLDAAGSAVTPSMDAAGRLAYLREAVALGASARGHASLFHGRAFMPVAMYMTGSVHEGDSAVNEFERLSRGATQPRVVTWRATLCALRASARGQYADVERFAAELQALDAAVEYLPARKTAERTLILLALYRGDREELERTLANFQPEIHYEFALQSLLRAALGQAEEALKTFGLWDFLPANGANMGRQNLSRVMILAEIVILLGDTKRAQRALDLLNSHGSETFAWGLMAGFYLGSMARRMGSLCALLGQWEEAEAHFERALAVDAPAELQLAHTELSYAGALRMRNRAEDKSRVQALAAHARERFERFGIAAFATRAEKLLDSVVPPATQEILIAPPPRGFSLAREGDYWALTTNHVTVRLKDSKGLVYLDRLVQNPGREFHVLELASELHARAASDLGDAGSLLDADAKQAYRRRVEELEDTIEEARSFGDSAREGRAREELDAIAEQLAQAVGLGGRDRRAASAAERARVNVQKRLRGTIARIEEEDRALGKFLDAAVKTGTYCVFEPPMVY